MSPVLHVAGPMGPDQIQRCARCFTPLKDKRKLHNGDGVNVIPPVTYSGGAAYPEGAVIECGDHYQAIGLRLKPEARACRVTTIDTVVDELTYRSYRENRRLSPQVSPERWLGVYLNALNLETRYQEEQAAHCLLVGAFGAGVLS